MKLKRLAAFGASLVLSLSSLFVFAPSMVHAATVTWDGGGDGTDFSDAVNWAGDVVPNDGDELVFPSLSGAGASRILSNDLLTSIGSITIQDGADNPNAYRYTINSSVGVTTFTLNGDITVGDNQILSISHSVDLGADVTVTLNDDNSSFGISGPMIDLDTLSSTLGS